MKFVEDHLNTHHLFRKPHRWFLAFLSSPIHYAELHYKRKYHLTFRHAKKLFAFDMLLLASVLVLIGATVFWFTYDPTVSSDIRVSVTASSDRIRSGETVTYTVTFVNHSNALLTDARLALQLPDGFQIDATPLFSDTNRSAELNDIPPGAEESFEIPGRFFDIPERQNSVAAVLSYRQSDRNETEIKVARVLTALRGSVLAGELDIPEHALGNGTQPFTFTLTNTGETSLTDIVVPLAQQRGITLGDLQTNAGEHDQEIWTIPTLDPSRSITLTGTMETAFGPDVVEAALGFIPSLLVDDVRIDQATTQQDISLLHPDIEFVANWIDAPQYLQPGDAAILSVSIANVSDVPLEAVSLRLPVPSNIVSLSQLQNTVVGAYRGETLTIDGRHNAALSALDPGETQRIEITIPLRSAVQGKDVALVLRPSVSARIPLLPTAQYQTNTETNALSIGTSLSLTAESRYFTDEGDQLGRGPLPPTVGKQSKYWALVRIYNATSDVSNPTFTATLPAGITWTERSSVSHGQNIQYDPSSGNVRWSTNRIAAGDTVGIFMELGITPTEAMRGTTPVLLKNMRVSAQDSYIDVPVVSTHAPVDIGIPNDGIGRVRGSIVK